MARLGLVAQQGDTWLDTGKSLDLSGKEERPRGSLRQYVAKAIESLDKDPFESIDISGATVSISSRRIAEARELIRDFHRRICALLEDGRKDAVYRVNVQLFPLSMSEDTPGTNGTAVFS